MSKHIDTYCDNCDTPYNDDELCDCETAEANEYCDICGAKECDCEVDE